MSFFKRIQHQLRYGLTTRSLLSRLKKLGIEVTPYILYEECVENIPPPDAAMAQEYSIETIVRADLKAIGQNFPDPIPIAWWERRLSSGHIGFLMRHAGNMVGYIWADTTRCEVTPRTPLFDLAPEQAYLRDVFVTRSFRGKGLAGLLHNYLCVHLGGEGRKNLYSICEFFNAPARKFNSSVGAIPLEIRLSLELYNRAIFDIKLREYRRET